MKKNKATVITETVKIRSGQYKIRIPDFLPEIHGFFNISY